MRYSHGAGAPPSSFSDSESRSVCLRIRRVEEEPMRGKGGTQSESVTTNAASQSSVSDKGKHIGRHLSIYLITIHDMFRFAPFIISISTVLLLLLGRTTHAFVAVPTSPSSNSCCIRSRTDSSLQMTVLTSGSKKIDIPEGTPLKDACAKLGVKPKYSCKR